LSYRGAGFHSLKEDAYSGIHVSSGNFNKEEGIWFKRKKDDVCFTRGRFLLTKAEFYFKLLMIMIIIIKLNLIINKILK